MGRRPERSPVFVFVFSVVFAWTSAVFREVGGEAMPSAGKPPSGRGAWTAMAWGVGSAVALSIFEFLFVEVEIEVVIGVAVLGAASVALLQAIWRQRFREGRVYRDELRSKPPKSIGNH